MTLRWLLVRIYGGTYSSRLLQMLDHIILTKRESKQMKKVKKDK